MPEPIALTSEPPPAPRRRGAQAITVLLLGTWFVFTFFAAPMTPVVITIAEWVEVTGGFDVMRGEEVYVRPGEKTVKPATPVENDK